MLIVLVPLALIAAGVVFYYYKPIWHAVTQAFTVLSDRERIEGFISLFGVGAPIVFMVIQILQVLLAPIPGEATGFAGGYLFGTIKGFLYSTIALTVGSWMNFAIGRFLGIRYVRKFIPPEKLHKFDRLARREGFFLIFLLFLFPGFPKDWLCLFLGISALPIKAFLIVAAVGRMPGTLMLSLQGDMLFQGDYEILSALIGLSLVAAFVAYVYREKLYKWIEKVNGSSIDHTDN